MSLFGVSQGKFEIMVDAHASLKKCCKYLFVNGIFQKIIVWNSKYIHISGNNCHYLGFS